MNLIDGKSIAKDLLLQAKAKIEANNLSPKLGIIFVGDNKASEVYVNKKKKTGESIGVEVEIFRYPTISKEGLLEVTTNLASDTSFNGIIIQLPVPDFYPAEAMAAIPVTKDVDGLNPLSLGKLWQNQTDVLIPATPLAVIEALRFVASQESLKLEEYLSGKNAVIVNRSDILGKPLAAILLQNNATVTIAHSRTEDLKQVCSNADVLVCATGQAGMFDQDYLKAGAVVIDVGFNKNDIGIMGDVNKDAIAEKASWLSPVPGGIGPLGVAMLILNTVTAATNQST